MRKNEFLDLPPVVKNAIPTRALNELYKIFTGRNSYNMNVNVAAKKLGIEIYKAQDTGDKIILLEDFDELIKRLMKSDEKIFNAHYAAIEKAVFLREVISKSQEFASCIRHNVPRDYTLEEEIKRQKMIESQKILQINRKNNKRRYENYCATLKSNSSVNYLIGAATT
nr:MAG TPA: hypothetical protein [Caudoviricetes sp.]